MTGTTNQVPAEQTPTAGTEDDASVGQAATPQKPGQSAAERQEFYWRRQAEKAQSATADLRREVETLRKAGDAEAAMLRAERDEALAKMRTAEEKALRLAVIADAGLPADLAQLVPEAAPEKVKEYVEKLKPLADRLRAATAGGTVTNPARSSSGDAARLNQLGAAAGRGDKGALREYAHLRETLRSK